MNKFTVENYNGEQSVVERNWKGVVKNVFVCGDFSKKDAKEMRDEMQAEWNRMNDIGYEEQ